MAGKAGRTRARGTKLPPKTPKSAGVPSSGDQTPLFCFRHADRTTSQPWAFRPDAQAAAELLDFLCEMGRLRWNEIERQQTGGARRRRKHHDQPIGSLDPGAQADLRKRKLDETFGDEMFRFRLGGTARLWGFRVNRTFHVVWWDPQHQVYPTETT